MFASTASHSTNAARHSCPSSRTCRRKKRSTRNSPCASTFATQSRSAAPPSRWRNTNAESIACSPSSACNRSPDAASDRPAKKPSPAANAADSTSASISAAAPRCSFSTNQSPDSPQRTRSMSPKHFVRWLAKKSSLPHCIVRAPRCSGFSTRSSCSMPEVASRFSAHLRAWSDTSAPPARNSRSCIRR